MKETELKPCPFCGGEARRYEGQSRYHGVSCRKCTCNIYGYASRSAATRAWNRRTDTIRPFTFDTKFKAVFTKDHKLVKEENDAKMV